MVFIKRVGVRMMRTKPMMTGGKNGRQHGMTLLGMLLLVIVIAFVALIAMKVVPMYVQYFSIKSTIESIRKEPQLAQMSAQDIQKGIEKRFDIGYVNNVKAQDLKIKNEQGGRSIELVYNDERELFYGLYVVLKVNEKIFLGP